MKKDKVVSNYERWSDFELSTLGGRVFVAMSDPATVANFPAPDPDLETLEELSTDFISKHEIASRRGSALQVSEKNESRAALLVGLRKLAHYVNGVAEGRTSLLLSTGLVLASAVRRLEVPGVTPRVRLRDGALKGQLRLDFDPVQHAWEYEVGIGESELGTPENVLWVRELHTTSSRANVLTGLIAGTLYHVRIRARNGRGIGDWSEPVTMLAR